MKKWTSLLLVIFLAAGLAGCGSAAKQVNGAAGGLEPEPETGEPQQEVRHADWEKYFAGGDGCAVVYDPQAEQYTIYNEELCKERVSPCSTFKIAAALIGLKNGAVESMDSQMGYDGTRYPAAAWNEDLTLKEAFQSSCVWYFRKLIDKVGQDEVRRELKALHYGNCDVSQWQGSGCNPLPELNGFWLESSLQISPLEQVKILSRIFEGQTSYEARDIAVLRELMLTEERGGTVYGKTGTGTTGIGWFTGFCEQNGGRLYFAVCLRGSNSAQANGKLAEGIAVRILQNEMV